MTNHLASHNHLFYLPSLRTVRIELITRQYAKPVKILHQFIAGFPSKDLNMWTVKALRTNSHGILSRNLLPLQRKSLSTGNGERVMAIRREDINVWERRAPIAPSHVAELAHKGIKVLVQPSTRRAYTMDEYERAGAVITEDLSPASLIIGVKAVPIDLLIPDKTYAFFSHTIKAQEANMPLLDAMLEKVRIFSFPKL